MILDKYIVITKGRGYSSLTAKIIEREPKLNANEISLRLRLEVPNALFERPKLEAHMKLPDTVVPSSKITVDITDNVEKIIKETTGLTMVVSVIDQEPDKKTK